MINMVRGCVTMVVAVGILCFGYASMADDGQQRATPTPKPPKAAKTPRVNRPAKPAKSGGQRDASDRARARERRENEQRRRKAERQSENREKRDDSVRNRKAVRTAPQQPAVTPVSGYVSTMGLGDPMTSRTQVQTNIPDAASTAPRVAATPGPTPAPTRPQP